MRFRTWAIVVLTAGAIGWAIYHQATKPETVNVAVARSGVIERFIEERAKTRLPNIYRITMPAQARVLPIDLEEGTRVFKGQVVAQLDPKDLALRVAEAEARVARLDAEIAENDDMRLEESALEQTNLLLESVEKTVASAKEQTEASKARDELMQTELERVRRLFERNAVSQEELQRAEVSKVESWVDYQKDVLSLRSNEAIQRAAQIMPLMIRQQMDRKGLRSAVLEKQRVEAVAQLDQVRREQERGAIASPVDGVVLARHISNEQSLGAGELLLEIGRLDDIEIEAEVLTEDAVEVQVGNEVRIFGQAVGDASLKGRVERIFPAGFTKISSLGVEQQRVLVIIRFADDPDVVSRIQRLGPEYRVRARIVTDSKPDAIVVPRTALIRSQDGRRWQAFVVREGRLELTDVSLGLTNDREAEIVSGVDAGEMVVLAPDGSVTDGLRVNAQVQEETP